MKPFYFLLFTFYLYSCSGIPGMPGHVSTHTSKFDGKTEIRMEPAWVDNAFKVGLFYNSNMPDGYMVLSVWVKDAYTITGAAVRVDETIYPLDAAGDYTDFERQWAYRRFVFPEKLLGEMISAEDCWVKVNFDDKYTEGKFSRDDPTAARPGFKNFYAKMEGF